MHTMQSPQKNEMFINVAFGVHFSKVDDDWQSSRCFNNKRKENTL